MKHSLNNKNKTQNLTDDSLSLSLSLFDEVVERKIKHTQFFVDEYNKKHADHPLSVKKCRISKKDGPPLDGAVVETCIQKYDDLFVRIKTSNSLRLVHRLHLRVHRHFQHL